MCVRPLIDFCSEKKLRVLTSDKEGFFVTIGEGTFREKALEVLEKNFKPVTAKSSEVKARAKSLLKRLSLEKLGASAGKAKAAELEIFFPIKTHKPGMPFRAIVSERNTWQQAVSKSFKNIFQV